MKKFGEQIFNPATFFGIGLYPILAVCTNFQNATRFALLTLVAMFLCSLLINLFRPIIVDEVRIPCYVLTILAVVYFLDSLISLFWAKTYMPITSLLSYLFVSSVVIFMLEVSKTKESFVDNIITTSQVVLSYAMCILIIGFVREFLSYGSIWGVKIGEFKGVSFFASFIGGLLLLCVYALIYNLIALKMDNKRRVFVNLSNSYLSYLKTAKIDVSIINTQQKEQPSSLAVPVDVIQGESITEFDDKEEA